MPAVYRYNILSMEAAANGLINCDGQIELRSGTTPDFIWTPTTNGHFTISLQATDILVITNDANLNKAQKRNAVQALIKTQVLSRGLDSADEAYQALGAGAANGILSPGDTVVLRQ